MLSEAEKFFFDVNGYLVIPDVLTPEQVVELNDAFDHGGEHIGELGFSLAQKASRFEAEHRRTEFDAPFGWPEPWGSVFRGLVALPRAVELMLETIGDGFRYDSMKGTIMQPGTEGFRLHGGGGVPGDLRFYQVLDGRISNGLMNIAYVLNDVEPGDGGFCCVPGSHKAHFPPPASVLTMETGPEHVRQITARAGSAVIFSEALIHGTLPWRGSKDRRTLFVRYSPGALLFRNDPLPEDYDSYADALTPLQRAIFEPPHFNDRPKIADLLAEQRSASAAPVPAAG
ncbi:MAG TPA: phytanoyl-CoA dioxygenase family protein [Pseudonocardiaceae bacterium]|jgi:hypothetical protein